MAKRISENYHVSTYLDYNDYQKLKKETQVRGRGTSISKTVRDCLNEYFSLREEMASAITAPGDAGDEQKGKIIHKVRELYRETFGYYCS